MHSQSYAVKIINCKQANYDHSIANDNFIKKVTQAVNHRLIDDQNIQCQNIPSDEKYFRIHLNLKRLTNQLEKIGIIATFNYPDEIKRTLVLSFDERKYSLNHLNLIAIKASHKIVNQLKIESGLIKNKPKLSKNFFENTYALNIEKKHLEIDIVQNQELRDMKMGKKALGRKEMNDKSKTKRVVLDLKVRDKYLKIDPNNPIPSEPVNALNKLNPFQKSLKKEKPYLTTLNYPSFQTAGILSAIYFPSLSVLESDLRNQLNIMTTSHLIEENFKSSNSNGVDKFFVNGTLFKQSVSISGHLWKKIRYNLQTGFGVHDSTMQFDITHPSATGSTTFLNSKKLSTGLLDSTLSLHRSLINNNFIIRPLFFVKIPTGDKENLLGSGHADFGLSIGTEYITGLWHYSSKMSFTRVGELDVFDTNQAELDIRNYASINLGVAREFRSPHHESFSIVLNYAQNPLRSNSNELADDIISLGSLWEKNVYKEINFLLDTSVGLSDSAPDFSMLASLKFKW
jgi:hypothetical protein